MIRVLPLLMLGGVMLTGCGGHGGGEAAQTEGGNISPSQ